MNTRCETCGQWLPGDRPHTCGEPNPPPPTSWPLSRVAHLLELNAAGMSTAGIAAELGCTKSMVAGKLFRELGPRPKAPKPQRPPKQPAPPPAPPPVPASIPSALPPTTERPPPLPRRVAGQRYAATGMLARIKKKHESPERPPSASAAPIAAPAAQAANPVTIYELTGLTCRWPLWPDHCMTVSDQFYCGAPAIEIGRYCAKHCAAAYNKPRS